MSCSSNNNNNNSNTKCCLSKCKSNKSTDNKTSTTTTTTTTNVTLNGKDTFTESNNVKFYDDDYIFYQEGNIPIILTFPHSGLLKFKDIPIRSKGVIDPDHYTDLLAISIIQCFNCVYCCCGCNINIDDGDGGNDINNNNSCSSCTCNNINFESNRVEYREECPRPYIVYSKIHREMCDFNRKEDMAFENQRLKQHYDLYHGMIRSFIEKVKSYHKEDQWEGRCLLLDIHGQSDCPEHLLRGTKDLKTVKGLFSRFGPDSIIGPNSIFGYLHEHGIPCFPTTIPKSIDTHSVPPPTCNPPVESAPSRKGRVLDPYLEHPHYNGAFTVQHYSQQIDTIQVEFGYQWRSKNEQRIQVAKVFRNAILAHYQKFISPKE
eukprot:gene4219-5283_t